MPLPRVSRCRSCGAPIRWAQTELGRRMPLDAEPYDGPEPAGLFVLRAGVAVAVPPAVFDDEPRYRSHFATCPDRDDWRRPR
jgi:hypothetical protein